MFWQRGEDDIIRNYYPDYAEIRRRLPKRGAGSIYHRAYKLGLTNKHFPKNPLNRIIKLQKEAGFIK